MLLRSRYQKDDTLGKKSFSDKTSKFSLITRLPIKARLKIARKALLDLLKSYPNLVPISYGKEISYYFDSKQAIFVFYFSDEYIIHEIYSSISPVYHLRESLLRLLGMLLFLGDAYQVDLQSLSPHLIFELSRKEIDSMRIDKLDNSTDPYQILSKRIIFLLNDIESISAKLEKTQGSLSNIVTILIKSEAQNGIFSSKEIAAKYSIDESLVLSSIDMLQKFGYKSIMHGEGRFSLVQL